IATAHPLEHQEAATLGELAELERAGEVLLIDRQQLSTHLRIEAGAQQLHDHLGAIALACGAEHTPASAQAAAETIAGGRGRRPGDAERGWQRGSHGYLQGGTHSSHYHHVLPALRKHESKIRPPDAR